MSSSVVLVRKARKPTQAVIAPTFDEPSTDVHRNIASIGNRLVEAWRILVAPLGTDTLHSAIRTRSADQIVAGLDWIGFTAAANALVTPLRHTVTSFARLEVTPLEKRRPVRKAERTYTVPLSTDPGGMKALMTDVDQRAIQYARGRGSRLITSVTDDTRASARALVTQAVSGDMTTDQLARRLRSVLPLRPDQVRSVNRAYDAQLRNRIEDAARRGLTPSAELSNRWIDEAQKVADRVAAKKLRERGILVARTEVVAASNQGRFAAWQATTAAGLTSPASRKEWVAAPDACPDCAEIDGETVGWDEEFSNGLLMPPDHPACRCSAVMLPPEAEQDPAPEPEPEPPAPSPDPDTSGLPDSVPLNHPARVAMSQFHRAIGIDGPGIDYGDVKAWRIASQLDDGDFDARLFIGRHWDGLVEKAGLDEGQLVLAQRKGVKLLGRNGYRTAREALDAALSVDPPPRVLPVPDAVAPPAPPRASLYSPEFDALPPSHVTDAVRDFAAKLDPKTGTGITYDEAWRTRALANDLGHHAPVVRAQLDALLDAAGIETRQLQLSAKNGLRLGGSTGFTTNAAALRAAKKASADALKILGPRSQKLLAVDAFPRLPDADIRAAASRANPLRTRGPAFRNNCHYVVSSVELRRRGFAVQARPTVDSRGRYTVQIQQDWVTPAGAVRPFTRVPAGMSSAYNADKVIAATADWPPGSRGFIAGAWNGGGAHIFNVEKGTDGRLIFHEGQTDGDASTYLGRMKPGTLEILRVDDLVPSVRVLDAVEDATSATPAARRTDLNDLREELDAATRRIDANAAQIARAKQEKDALLGSDTKRFALAQEIDLLQADTKTIESRRTAIRAKLRAMGQKVD